MHDNPAALELLCLSKIADQVANSEIPFEAKIEFLENSHPLPAEIGDRLLETLSDHRQLTKETLKLFRPSEIRLENVKIAGAELNHNDFQIFYQHNQLRALELVNIKPSGVDVPHLVSRCLSPYSRQQLVCLNLEGSYTAASVSSAYDEFSDEADSIVIGDSVASLCLLRNIRVLNVSRSEFGDRGLCEISKALHFLEFLDASETKITDISSISAWSGTLHGLKLYAVELRDLFQSAKALSQMRELELLDIAEKIDTIPVNSNYPATALAIKFVDEMTTFPLKNLKILDISGCSSNFDLNKFLKFVKMHKHLKFLGLFATNASIFDEVRDQDGQYFLRDIWITGNTSIAQILNSLSVLAYRKREPYCARIFYNFYTTLTVEIESFDPEQKPEDSRRAITHVLDGMKRNIPSLQVQMAGTACLYGLCRRDRVRIYEETVMRMVIDACLLAAKHHAGVLQLHKNVWLTLCNDHLLNISKYNMFDVCEQSVASMLSFADPALTRMTVAILSILAAKIPVDETVKLGGQPVVIKHLINLVHERIVDGADLDPHNSTLKFALSALWNLTDESPVTCENFLNEHGLPVMVKTLKKFGNTHLENRSIQMKVLGLLNNVAEVRHLKDRLVEPGALGEFRKLLKSPHLEVAYFSAGILAHLCADLSWDYPPNNQECENELYEVISNWPTPETEMVAYRSFRPFYVLLEPRQPKAVILWAAWAIRHVCSRNAVRYAEMFKAGGGLSAMEKLMADSGLDANLKTIVEDVIKLLRAKLT